MKVCLSARNGIGVGLLYIGLGIWLSMEDNPIKKWNLSPVFLLALALYALLVIEVSFTYGKDVLDDSSLFFAMPLLAVALLELSLRINIKISQACSIEIRRLSANLYYLHPALNAYVGACFIRICDNCLIRFIVVIALCLLVWTAARNSTNKYIRKVLP